MEAGLDGRTARIPSSETMAKEYIYAKDVGRAVDAAATAKLPPQHIQHRQRLGVVVRRHARGGEVAVPEHALRGRTRRAAAFQGRTLDISAANTVSAGLRSALQSAFRII